MSINRLSTMSPEIVLATFVPKMNAAMKLKNAAHATACVGVRTRVATTVAIELAASWKPLRKSKTNAMKMKTISSPSSPPATDCIVGAVVVVARRSITCIGVECVRECVSVAEELPVLQHDALERVPDVFAAVDRVLDVVVQLLPLQDFQRLRAATEELVHRRVVVVVPDALEVVDLDQLVAQLRELPALAQAVDRVLDGRRRRHEHVGLLQEVGLNVLHVKQRDAFRQRVDLVDDVVQLADELVDVLSIKRGDERAVEAFQRRMR